MTAGRTSRDEWRRRIERWQDSGLTAKEFAAETRLNDGTLQVWRYKLRKGDATGAQRRTAAPRGPFLSSIVELATSPIASAPHFEFELKNGRRVRVPATFESSALKALLEILDAA